MVRAAEKIAPRARAERMSAAARWAAHPPVHQSPLAKRALTRLLARSLCALHDQAALELFNVPCHTRILSVFVHDSLSALAVAENKVCRYEAAAINSPEHLVAMSPSAKK